MTNSVTTIYKTKQGVKIHVIENNSHLTRSRYKIYFENGKKVYSYFSDLPEVLEFATQWVGCKLSDWREV